MFYPQYAAPQATIPSISLINFYNIYIYLTVDSRGFGVLGFWVFGFTRPGMNSTVGFFTSKTRNTTVHFAQTMVGRVLFEEIKTRANAIIKIGNSEINT